MNAHLRMRSLVSALALLPCLAPTVFSVESSASQLTSTEQQLLQREARLVVDLLQNHHFSGRAFREIENKEMISRFLEELDPMADFLSQEDREFVHRRFDKTLKSVYLFRGDLQPAFEIFDLLAERARTRLSWVDRRLTQDFDLTVDETYAAPHKSGAAAIPVSTSTSDQRWEQHLKSQLVREILAGRTEADATETVAKRYRELGKRIATSDSFAIRERFFDAIIRSFDPHSGYFSADSTREFAVEMENAVSGIGLDLRKQAGRCVVAAVQPGGPADLHSTIGLGDTLAALAEGDEPWTDVTALRLREIVSRLRGEPGQMVRLVYRPEGSMDRIEVELKRARIVLPADRAHGAVSELSGSTGRKHRIGWITLPSFYTGGAGKPVTSAARDMRELLDQMAARKIDGLVLDLRANPGGALTEATAISELFLSRGCMMLSRSAVGQPTVHMIKEPSPAYAGPLVLLMSAHSASASEILAGALKFHQRALVIGGATTFGKGTAQNYIQLGKIPGAGTSAAKDWGTLRLTYERFYLPDGQAVQQVGVTSHVVLPDFDDPLFERETALPHALPPESITPPATPAAAETPALSKELADTLRQRAEHNFGQLPEWDLWRKEQKLQQTLASQETRSLQLSVRRGEWEETLRQYQANAGIRRPLALAAAYPTEPLEIECVQAAYAAHEARLRSPDRAGAPQPNTLHRGGFFVETDQGRLREIRLTDLGVTAFYGDTATLAAAFTAATSHPLAPADARRILEAIPLLEHPTDPALLAVVGRICGEKLPETVVRKGMEALLQRLTELDPEMRRERPALDIPLREAQRLAAAWAELTPPPKAP